MLKGGLGNLMKQARQMQDKMAKIQEEMASRTVEAAAGGGRLNGRAVLTIFCVHLAQSDVTAVSRWMVVRSST